MNLDLDFKLRYVSYKQMPSRVVLGLNAANTRNRARIPWCTTIVFQYPSFHNNALVATPSGSLSRNNSILAIVILSCFIILLIDYYLDLDPDIQVLLETPQRSSTMQAFKLSVCAEIRLKPFITKMSKT